MPEGGCYNDATNSVSVYGECGATGVENLQFFNNLHCTGSSIVPAQNVNNDACLNLTPVFGGGSVKMRCAACGVAVSFAALAVAVAVAVKNTLFAVDE